MEAYNRESSLNSIAKSLSGILYTDMSTAEKQIADELVAIDIAYWKENEDGKVLVIGLDSEKNKVAYVTVKVTLQDTQNPDADVENMLQEIDYTFEGIDESVYVVDTEIVDVSVTRPTFV